ncbi:MAG: hypothetical protein Fur0022_01570 [Anaerolineales bacterium]
MSVGSPGDDDEVAVGSTETGVGVITGSVEKMMGETGDKVGFWAVSFVVVHPARKIDITNAIQEQMRPSI